MGGHGDPIPVFSPDGSLRLNLHDNGTVTWSMVDREGDPVEGDLTE